MTVTEDCHWRQLVSCGTSAGSMSEARRVEFHDATHVVSATVVAVDLSLTCDLQVVLTRARRGLIVVGDPRPGSQGQ